MSSNRSLQLVSILSNKYIDTHQYPVAENAEQLLKYKKDCKPFYIKSPYKDGKIVDIQSFYENIVSTYRVRCHGVNLKHDPNNAIFLFCNTPKDSNGNRIIKQ